MLSQAPISTLFPYTTLFRSLGKQTTRDEHRACLFHLSGHRRPGGDLVVKGGQHEAALGFGGEQHTGQHRDRKSTRLNSSHVAISYAVFCLKKKKTSMKIMSN